MTQSMDSRAREVLALSYGSALSLYISGGGETALVSAYELGRKAASEGFGVLEIAMVHHEALRGVLAERRASLEESLTLAAQFFAEAISPFEMTLRAYQASARLLGLSETLVRQNAEIDRAREQLQTILDATTAIIYLKDVEGRYLFVNREFQRQFHLNREQVIGKKDEEILPPSTAAILYENDCQALQKQIPQEVEENLPSKNGLHTYLSLKFPLLDAFGVAHGICCVATDITERKAADEALRTAKETAEAANRELESFSYSVAHDLRSPLRTISGFSQILLEDYIVQLDSSAKSYLHRVIEASHHMAHLIDDLLALSRVSRQEFHKERVNLSTLVQRIAERLRSTEPERRVEFVIEEEAFSQGDIHLLEDVFENLLTNAWKFTSKQMVTRIEFGIEPGKYPPVYYVRDNGAGFNMEYVGKLFGVFQRLHSRQEFEGTGIGLATVQRIIKRHGGQIWAEGAVNQGATFYFTLEAEEELKKAS